MLSKKRQQTKQFEILALIRKTGNYGLHYAYSVAKKIVSEYSK
jgi:hypothetical protein